jgi:hypothetical protein|tara:strand:+ start:363 stop:761 length:399 start_codon:yes stop_codon:yes gene_type:complete
MKINKRRLIIFGISFLIPLIYYRLLILFLPKNYIPTLRELTSLNLHHLHYGIIIITITILLLLFYKINTFSTILSGLGLGLIVDTFIPSLFLDTVRENELLVYSQHFTGTIILFGIILILAISISIIANKSG